MLQRTATMHRGKFDVNRMLRRTENHVALLKGMWIKLNSAAFQARKLCLCQRPLELEILILSMLRRSNTQTHSANLISVVAAGT